MSNMNDDDFVRRHNKRIRGIKRRKMIRRTGSLIVIIAVTAVICMYKLPYFNVSQIKIEGNEILSAEEIAAKTGIKGGENLFRLNMRSIASDVKDIPYVDSVSVKRTVFPNVAVLVSIKESRMTACIKVDDGYVGIDRDAKVLETVDSVPEGVTEFHGINLTSFLPGEKAVCEDENILNSIAVICDGIEKFEYKDKISPVLIEDIGNISFYYDNRLNVICGSIIDFERKMDMLEEVIRSDDIKDNSRGTLDLRTQGKIIYTP
ncbi:MAG: FtsQ-type POTRA domain-containing protein [Oscillospiraceae bacterium]|nr:FtsQ-type POTRA domain-containing protein [Oscillospiraceae bacterium]